MKIAINGFGRIGKLVLRAFLEKKVKNIEVVAINENWNSLNILPQNASTVGLLDLKISQTETQDQFFNNLKNKKMSFRVSQSAKKVLLLNGTHREWGARPIRRI